MSKEEILRMLNSDIERARDYLMIKENANNQWVIQFLKEKVEARDALVSGDEQ